MGAVPPGRPRHFMGDRMAHIRVKSGGMVLPRKKLNSHKEFDAWSKANAEAKGEPHNSLFSDPADADRYDRKDFEIRRKRGTGKMFFFMGK